MLASPTPTEQHLTNEATGQLLHPDETRREGPEAPAAARIPAAVIPSTGSSSEQEREREELVLKLLSALPRSRLATIQRRIAPLLQFDVVGSLPTEIALQIFSHLSATSLLTCAAVSRRWQALADDPALWKTLCNAHGWVWRQPTRGNGFESLYGQQFGQESWREDSDDEGMGDSDEENAEDSFSPALSEVEQAKLVLTQMHAELDYGLKSMAWSGGSSLIGSLASASSADASTSSSPSPNVQRNTILPPRRTHSLRQHKIASRHSAPSVLKATSPSPSAQPNYKLLHQTHTRLINRFQTSAYRLSALQTRGSPTNSHMNTIYCLQLYTYPSGAQVLFTGSRDRTIREWNLSTGLVERVISGVHESSVLSLCVYKGFVASAGSDRRVAVWDLACNKLVKVICDHEDSVLCVRFDDERLVSCSKDRTVRTYSFPDLEPQFVLYAHRAAVNAVSISKNLIVSGSGDRSIKLWDLRTGSLLRTYDKHHSRGIASIDFRPPFVLSGSSDKHLRLFDITTLKGWSTSSDPHYEDLPTGADRPLPFPLPSTVANPPNSPSDVLVCQTCGSANAFNHPPLPVAQQNEGHGPAGTQHGTGSSNSKCMHGDLVRSVALGERLVVSGSYDLTIKVWDRKTGALVADLNHGHTGRIFCIGFDCTKIVSCGEDQRICIWDFSHGIDTSFIQL
ncbi:hypothetical protein HGRIS_012710 [Hohenbuehelia grisea]|uniref:F-box domain-containing protein n=1 Tax=Hohenbuehelia grisea TaxID=104357 RepID=A0ABR3IT73_9AGAR